MCFNCALLLYGENVQCSQQCADGWISKSSLCAIRLRHKSYCHYFSPVFTVCDPLGFLCGQDALTLVVPMNSRGQGGEHWALAVSANQWKVTGVSDPIWCPGLVTKAGSRKKWYSQFHSQFCFRSTIQFRDTTALLLLSPPLWNLEISDAYPVSSSRRPGSDHKQIRTYKPTFQIGTSSGKQFAQ